MEGGGGLAMRGGGTRAVNEEKEAMALGTTKSESGDEDALMKEMLALQRNRTPKDIHAEQELAHWFPAFTYGERLRLTDLSGPPPKDIQDEEVRLVKQFNNYKKKEKRGRDLHIDLQPDEAAQFESFKPPPRRGPRMPRFAAASREESKVVVLPKPQLLPPRILRMRSGESSAGPIISEPPAPKLEGPALVSQIDWEEDVLCESDDDGDEHEASQRAAAVGMSQPAADHGAPPQLPSGSDSALASSPETKDDGRSEADEEAYFLPDVPQADERRKEMMETASQVAQRRLNALRLKQEQERRRLEQARIARGRRGARGRPRGQDKGKTSNKASATATPKRPASRKPTNAARRNVNTEASQRRFLVGGQTDATYTVDVTDCVKQERHKPMDLPQRFSMLEPYNTALATTRWEDDVLYDSEDEDEDSDSAAAASRHKPEKPKIVLDLNDPHMVYDFAVARPRRRVEYVLQQNKGRLRIPDWKLEEIARAMAPRDTRFMTDDKFNLSNDRFYSTKHENPYHWSNLIFDHPVRHATSALRLDEKFFPTNLTQRDLRYFHRPTLRNIVENERSPLRNANLLPKKEPRKRSRDAQRAFEMDDITAKTDNVLLAEYSEEHPFFIMRPAMCTVIRNFYRTGGGPKKQLPYGIDIPIERDDGSPFLGRMARGQTLQAFENNMFRAPAYAHHVRKTDFLVVRNPQTKELYVRYVGDIFVIGQLMPKRALPAPNSKNASDLQRNRLKAFVYRQFLKRWHRRGRHKKRQRRTERPRLRVDAIKRAMPDQSDTNIRRVLKECATFQRRGDDSGAWEWKRDTMITKDDLYQLMSPEEVCALESMLAAEQRLRDMGYKTALIDEAADEARRDQKDEDEEDEEGGSGKGVVDEAKLAPWCLTQDFVDFLQSKCLLGIVGRADPTGSGGKLGMSYVRIAKKPSNARVHDPNAKKKSDETMDLRKLPLGAAKRLLIERYNMNPEDLRGVSRWHIIGIVRHKSTEEAKVSQADLNYARNSNSAVAQHRRKFESRCQAAFNGQNASLASIEEPPSDDEGAGEQATEAEKEKDEADEAGSAASSSSSSISTKAQQAKGQDAVEGKGIGDGEDAASLVSESVVSETSTRVSKRSSKKGDEKDKFKKPTKKKKKKKKTQKTKKQQQNKKKKKKEDKGGDKASQQSEGGKTKPENGDEEDKPNRRLKIYRAYLRPEFKDRLGHKPTRADVDAHPSWFMLKVETVEDPRVVSAYVMETKARLAEQHQHNKRYGVNAPKQSVEGVLKVGDNNVSATELSGTKLRLNINVMQRHASASSGTPASRGAGKSRRGSSRAAGAGGTDGGGEQPTKRAKVQPRGGTGAGGATSGGDDESVFGGDAGRDSDARSVSSRVPKAASRRAGAEGLGAKGPLRVRLSLAGESAANSEVASDTTGSGQPSFRLRLKATVRKLNETLKRLLEQALEETGCGPVFAPSDGKLPAAPTPSRGKSKKVDPNAVQTLRDVLMRTEAFKYRSLSRFEEDVRVGIDNVQKVGGPSVDLQEKAKHLNDTVYALLHQSGTSEAVELEAEVVRLQFERKKKSAEARKAVDASTAPETTSGTSLAGAGGAKPSAPVSNAALAAPTTSAPAPAQQAGAAGASAAGKSSKPGATSIEGVVVKTESTTPSTPGPRLTLKMQGQKVVSGSGTGASQGGVSLLDDSLRMVDAGDSEQK